MYFNYSIVNITLRSFLHNHVNCSKQFYLPYFIESSGFVLHLIVPDSLNEFVFTNIFDSVVGGHLDENSWENNTIIIQKNRSQMLTFRTIIGVPLERKSN